MTNNRYKELSPEIMKMINDIAEKKQPIDSDKQKTESNVDTSKLNMDESSKQNIMLSNGEFGKY
jgi:methyl-accepting chemotaxis protein